ncbi:MAG: hypothetical protein ACD_42C00075G0002 [uncultured bacterium]|nr:MAG: hypothetical protein ACD_42C00075G0002 [uncultured bacterium]OGT32905.1 MAG: hypothetical protein A3C44_05040 [Gammaproteobacteria bacterium RIFCSPHIGHO2_02_FULL_39_13]OGT50563.1 MAG: hypothetical protein A3E53_03475 [Gammaproteobacteria bacterium RIFCSPHIGHO2_12_FULL_39_24]
MTRKMVFAIGILLSVLLFPGCQQKKTHAAQDAKKYIDVLEKAMEQTTQKELKKKSAIPAYVYDADHIRDPFELPTTVKKKKEHENVILQDVALDSLKLTGIVLHDNDRVAIFRANDGKLYSIRVGTRVGLQEALLTQIGRNEVKFKIEIDTGAGQESRDVTLSLQESPP